MSTVPIPPDPPASQPRTWNRALLVASIVAAVCAGNLCCYLASEYTYSDVTPELSADPEVLVLRAVDAGAEVPFSFRIANRSRRAVTITDATTSCGCTVIDRLKGVRLESGQLLEVRGKVGTTGIRGKRQVNALVEYQTDAPSRKGSLILTVNAVVRPVIRALPEALRLEPGRAGAGRATGVVYIDSTREASFSVLEARPSVSWLKVEVARSDFQRGGKPIEIHAHVEADQVPEDRWAAPIGQQSIHVKTTSRAEPELTIPVRIRKAEGSRS